MLKVFMMFSNMTMPLDCETVPPQKKKEQNDALGFICSWLDNLSLR